MAVPITVVITAPWLLILTAWHGCACVMTVVDCVVSEEVGLPSLRRYLLDQDQHQEPGTQQESRAEGDLSEN